MHTHQLLLFISGQRITHILLRSHIVVISGFSRCRLCHRGINSIECVILVGIILFLLSNGCVVVVLTVVVIVSSRFIKIIHCLFYISIVVSIVYK